MNYDKAAEMAAKTSESLGVQIPWRHETGLLLLPVFAAIAKRLEEIERKIEKREG